VLSALANGFVPRRQSSPELVDLDSLAANADQDHVYECLFSVKPLTCVQVSDRRVTPPR
jgi:hypothetical protein